VVTHIVPEVFAVPQRSQPPEEEHLADDYERRITKGSGHLWAADWWRYLEAGTRIEAMWRAWEHLQLDPATGMSDWFRDHADHHMRLMNPDWGPFGKRGHETDDVTTPLPYEELPTSLQSLSPPTRRRFEATTACHNCCEACRAPDSSQRT
jgi:glycine/D-amino acid oxidase-like deaminating enzyme